MKHIPLLLAFALMASAAFAQNDTLNSPGKADTFGASSKEGGVSSSNRKGALSASYKDGESLTYTVSYRASMWPNTDMGIVSMDVAEEKLDGVATFKVSAYARVKGMFRWFYKLDDYYDSWLAADSFRPVKATCELTEGSYRYTGSFDYDWREMKVLSRYRNHRNPEPTVKTMVLAQNAMDAVSQLYRLRSMDIASYEEGEINSLNLLLDDTIRVINYKFYGRETRDVLGLGQVKTLKFSCQLVTSDAQSFEEGDEFFVWISDDPNKVPLYIELPLRVGSARVRLSDYKNLKFPRESVLYKK